MSFKLKIENFGKLSNEEVRIGPFTVFAGPNNTGKSFVSRLLYSLFHGMDKDNHASVRFHNLVTPLKNRLSRLERRGGYQNEDLPLSLLTDKIGEIQKIVEPFSIHDSEESMDRWSEIVDHTRKLCDQYRIIKPSIVEWFETNRRQPPVEAVTETLEGIEKVLDDLLRGLEETNARDFILTGVKQKIFRDLTQNFQVSTLTPLRTLQEKPSKIFIDGIGSFELGNSELVDFKIEEAGLQQLQDYSRRVIYLESPIYWKLQPALESLLISTRYSYPLSRERLSKVPGYFYDLAWELKGEYSGDVAFPELYEKLISKEVLGGKLTLSETGELRFQENGRSFPLPLTAMGVVNLGILALLIERKIIDEGTFLFIDEPEAHLHPSWQVKIAKTLFELSRLGVNVVIATHSAEILKFLEVEIKEHPEREDIIALNHFTSSGVKNYEDNFISKLSNIKKELTEPYTDLYLKGL